MNAPPSAAGSAGRHPRGWTGAGPRGGVTGLAAALLCTLAAGCAQAPQALYGWDDFTWQQYRHLSRTGVADANRAEEVEAMTRRLRASGRPLPPGLRAHQGLLRLESGDAEGAARMWDEERRAFPESAPYLDRMIEQARGLRARRSVIQDPT